MKRIALITGAGSGIGRAVAIKLSEHQWHVVLTGRREPQLRETAGLSSPDATTVVASDVTDPRSVEQLFDRIKNDHGRLDLLFNNAGVGSPVGPVEDLPVEKWKEIMEINVTGSFLCSQQAIKLMKQQEPRGGRIINNGSISAHVPRPQAAAYTVSKHAITGLTRACSLEGRSFDIACGQIDIGNAKTDMTARMQGGVLQADGSERAEPTMPVQGVSEAVLYMANLPLETNVPFMTVMANEMPYMGRG